MDGAKQRALAREPVQGRREFRTRNTNGTGPFMLKSRRPDIETVLAANPNWWDKRAHNVDEVVYRPIRLDATRIAALLSGELDLVIPAPLQDVDRIKADAALDVLIGSDLRVMMLGLSQGAPKLNSSNLKDKNPLADKSVREALTRAIDKDTLSRRVMRGLSKPTATIVAPQIQGRDPTLAENKAPYDPERAKKLLAQAGYPDGFELGMDCPNDEYVNAELVCQAVAAMWARRREGKPYCATHRGLYAQDAQRRSRRVSHRMGKYPAAQRIRDPE